ASTIQARSYIKVRPQPVVKKSTPTHAFQRAAGIRIYGTFNDPQDGCRRSDARLLSLVHGLTDSPHRAPFPLQESGGPSTGPTLSEIPPPLGKPRRHRLPPRKGAEIPIECASG